MAPSLPERVTEDEDGLVRLQKLLAQSGVASRRKCEELMLDGKVVVDGEVVTRLGTKVDPRTAVIRVDGQRLPPVSDTSTWPSTSRAASSRPCPTPRAGARSATWWPSGPSGSSTSGASTPTPPGC